MILPPDSNLLLHENSMIGLASSQLSVKFFPGCLPVLPWPHLSWVSLKRLPGAHSSSTILIWLNTWFILSLWWGRPFVLIGPVNLQPPFRAIYWAGLRGRNEGERLQFSIYPLSLSKKTPKKLPFTATACGFLVPELTFYLADYTCCEWLICKIDTFATDFINLWLEPWRAVFSGRCCRDWHLPPCTLRKRRGQRERESGGGGGGRASLSGRRERHFKSEGLLDVK